MLSGHVLLARGTEQAISEVSIQSTLEHQKWDTPELHFVAYDIMSPSHDIPQPLKIVAYLFIVGGMLCVLNVIIALMNARIRIDLGVFGIFIGIGLLRLNPRSHTWAMLFTWIGMIISPIVTLIFLITPGQLKMWGRTVGQAPPGFGFLLGVLCTMLVYWQYSVLSKTDTRRIFGKIP